MSYDSYAQRAPPKKLQLILDGENEGLDLHLGMIADEFDEDYMQNVLSPRLGLRTRDVKDIVKSNYGNPGAIRYHVDVLYLVLLPSFIHGSIQIPSLVPKLSIGERDTGIRYTDCACMHFACSFMLNGFLNNNYLKMDQRRLSDNCYGVLSRVYFRI